MPRVKIVCLANSRKSGGRCVAGLRVDGKGWVRPIADREGGALLVRETLLDDGTESRVLDVIEVPLGTAKPDRYQPENWLISDGPWKLVSRTEAGVRELIERSLASGPDILGNQADHIPMAAFSSQAAVASLAVTRPTSLEWLRERDYYGRERTRVLFKVGGATHILPLTDPVWESKLKSLEHGIHARRAAGLSKSDDVLLTVSLGGPYRGDCYKFVAAIGILN
jgi:hypothetical protein